MKRVGLSPLGLQLAASSMVNHGKAHNNGKIPSDMREKWDDSG